MKKLTETLNIRGNDPIAFVKTMQVSPWFQHMKCTTEIENKNSIVMTVTHCLTLDALEKEGRGRQHTTCAIVEPKLIQLYASLFNPKMRAKNLTPLSPEPLARVPATTPAARHPFQKKLLSACSPVPASVSRAQWSQGPASGIWKFPRPLPWHAG